MAILRTISPPGRLPTYTYDVFFYFDTISTTVTHDPIVVTQWICDGMLINFGSPRIILVGFDTKCLLPYGPGPNQTATVNLCIGDRCLIYQIMQAHFRPHALIELFSDAKFGFASIAVLPRMQRLFNDHGMANDARQTLDLGTAVATRYGMPELANAGLRRLASVVLGKEMDTPQYVTESAWNAWQLTPEQVHYASVEAFVSWQIADTLINPVQP